MDLAEEVRTVEQSVNDIVRAKLDAFCKRLSHDGHVVKYELNDADGVNAVFIGKSAGRTASIEMTPTTEFYFLKLDDIYDRVSTAYDLDSKLEEVEDMMEDAEAFLSGNYREDVYEQGGARSIGGLIFTHRMAHRS